MLANRTLDPHTHTHTNIHLWLMILLFLPCLSYLFTYTYSNRLKSTHEAHFYCHQPANLIFAAIVRYLSRSIIDFCLSRRKNVSEIKICGGASSVDEVYHWLLSIQIDLGRLDTCVLILLPEPCRSRAFARIAWHDIANGVRVYVWRNRTPNTLDRIHTSGELSLPRILRSSKIISSKISLLIDVRCKKQNTHEKMWPTECYRMQ